LIRANFFMIRYPKGIQQQGNNGTIRRNGKADEGRTGREAGSEQPVALAADRAFFYGDFQSFS
jgi:hypothetical protein